MLVLAVLAVAAPAAPARHEAIVLSSHRPAVRKVQAREASTLSLAVRGRACSGAPRLIVTVDGARVLSVPVRSRGWRTVSTTAAVAAGSHTVRLRLANPRRTAHCRRSVGVRGMSLTPQRHGAPGSSGGSSPHGSTTPPAGAPGSPPRTGGSRWIPGPRTTWQWQLSGTVDQSVPADMYDVDLFDTPASTVASLHAKGRRVTCYLDAGTYEPGRPDSGSFPASAIGSDVSGWPGEKWLDVRRLDVLGPIMRSRLDLCASKGFDAVEADNVDGYSNSSGFPLSADDQLRYNRFLASEAHARGLSIALKNDFEQVAQLEPSFDFAVSEECFQYGECGRLAPFTAAGKAVFEVEYAGDPASYCPQAKQAGFMAMGKNMSLDAPRQPCW
jgi:hypothetical protein